MIKFGTLSDFKEAKRKCTESGVKFTVTQSPSGLIRKLIAEDEGIILAITRFGNVWVFRYNPKYWGEN